MNDLCVVDEILGYKVFVNRNTLHNYAASAVYKWDFLEVFTC